MAPQTLWPASRDQSVAVIGKTLGTTVALLSHYPIGKGKGKKTESRNANDAVMQLPQNNLAQFAAWFKGFQAQQWDEQIIHDAHANRFDTLIQRAKERVKPGKSHRLTLNAPLIP